MTEALLNYFHHYFLNNAEKQSFISQPPGPAILLWSNKNSVPNLTGISIVRQLEAESYNNNQLNALNNINFVAQNIIRETQIPFLNIEYDIDNEILIINNKQFDLEEGGRIIAQNFQLEVDNTITKTINNSQSVIDPFHLWSRNYFSGSKVTKIDLDMVVLNASNTISSIVEIKRSAKTQFDNWQPYQADNVNYRMLFNLSENLDIPFFTVHHNEVQNPIIDSQKLLNIYAFNSPDIMEWNEFRAIENRQQITVEQLVHLL